MVLDIYPTFIPLNWIKKGQKRVPIKLQMSEVKGYAYIKDSCILTPDYVDIEGPMDTVDITEIWLTEQLEPAPTPGRQTGTIALKKSKNFDLSSSNVQYSIYLHLVDTLEKQSP
jgi:hypothetical protein